MSHLCSSSASSSSSNNSHDISVVVIVVILLECRRMLLPKKIIVAVVVVVIHLISNYCCIDGPYCLHLTNLELFQTNDAGVFPHRRYRSGFFTLFTKRNNRKQIGGKTIFHTMCVRKNAIFTRCVGGKMYFPQDVLAAK